MGKMSGDLLIVVLACSYSSHEMSIMFLKSFEYFQKMIKCIATFWLPW